jgi:hypothetical protein
LSIVDAPEEVVVDTVQRLAAHDALAQLRHVAEPVEVAEQVGVVEPGQPVGPATHQLPVERRLQPLVEQIQGR